MLLIQQMWEYKYLRDEDKQKILRNLIKKKKDCNEFKTKFDEISYKIKNQAMQIIESSRNSIATRNSNLQNAESQRQSMLQEVLVNPPLVFNELDYFESVIDHRQNQIKLIHKIVKQLEDLSKITGMEIKKGEEALDKIDDNVGKTVINIKKAARELKEADSYIAKGDEGIFATNRIILSLIAILILLTLIAISK